MIIARIRQSEQKIGKEEVSASQSRLIVRLLVSPPSDIPLEFGRFVIAASLLSSRITEKMEKLRERVLSPSLETEERFHLERKRADRLAAELEDVRKKLGERLRKKREQLSTLFLKLEQQRQAVFAELNERIATVKTIRGSIASFQDQERAWLEQYLPHDFRGRSDFIARLESLPGKELHQQLEQELYQLRDAIFSGSELSEGFSLIERLTRGLQDEQNSVRTCLNMIRNGGGFVAFYQNLVDSKRVFENRRDSLPHRGSRDFRSKFNQHPLQSHLTELSDEKIFSQLEFYLSEMRLIELLVARLRKEIEDSLEEGQYLEKLTAELEEMEEVFAAQGIREVTPSLPKTAEGAAATDALKALREEVIKLRSLLQEEERLASGLPDSSETVKEAKKIILDGIALYRVPVLDKIDEWIELAAAADSSALPTILSTIIHSLEDAAKLAPNFREKMNALKELEPSLISSAAQEAISGIASQTLEASQWVSSWCDEMDKPWSVAEAAHKLQKAVNACSKALSKLKSEIESSKEDERTRSLREMREAVAGCVQGAASQLRAAANASPIDSQALMNRIAIMEESQLDEVIAAIGTHFLTEPGNSKVFLDVGKTLQMRVRQWGITLEPNFPHETSLLIHH